MDMDQMTRGQIEAEFASLARTMYFTKSTIATFSKDATRGQLVAGWAEKKVLRKFASCKVLILDDWLIDKPTTEQMQMHFLLELTARRAI